MAGSSSHASATDIPVSQQEFNMFHAIDRTLFSRLVFNLGRDPTEATQVIALWLWLEIVGEEIDLMNSKILSLPDALLHVLVDESVLALACTKGVKLPFASHSADIPFIKNLTKSKVSLRYFHDNRIAIIRGVRSIINEVCVRAFDDIVKLARGSEELPNYGARVHKIKPNNFYGPRRNPSLPAWRLTSGVVVRPHHTGALQVFPRYGTEGGPSDIFRGLDPCHHSLQRQILNNEICGVLSRIKLSTGEEEDEVPPDDRTIFLTFSKGYPISETEITQFFTRKFGDIIEAFHLQEVLSEEQPLYARLVTRSASFIGVVLDGKGRAKFSINGKHVWARKYVRRSPRSPLTSSPSASRPTSPAS